MDIKGKKKLFWGKIWRSRRAFFVLLVCLIFVVLVIDTKVIRIYPLSISFLSNSTSFKHVFNPLRNFSHTLSMQDTSNVSVTKSPYVIVSINGQVLQSNLTRLKRNRTNGEGTPDLEGINNSSPKSRRIKSYNGSSMPVSNNKLDIPLQNMKQVTKASLLKNSKLTTTHAAKATYRPSPKYGAPEVCSEDYKSRHLMTSNLDGRAGNQMFQLMTLIAAANDSCYMPVIRQEEIRLDKIFNIKNVARKTVDTSQFGRVGESGWAYYRGPIVRKVNQNLNYTILGFRQSFHYFQHKRELITSSFVFKDNIKLDVAKYFVDNSLDAKLKIGVHIRRGDFLLRKNIIFGYVGSSVEYVNRAMDYYTDSLKETNLAFIFVSDDITWCRENFKSDNAYFSPFKDPGWDLHILTQCDHNIISTGSFSWMGAWLNETGKVIYDKSFPRPKSMLWRGFKNEYYYPDWWIGL